MLYNLFIQPNPFYQVRGKLLTAGPQLLEQGQAYGESSVNITHEWWVNAYVEHMTHRKILWILGIVNKN